MNNGITLKLLSGRNIAVNEAEKNHCFFVGKEGQQCNAVFEKAYEITSNNWPDNVSADYEIGSRTFSDLSYSAGSIISRARGAYYLKKHIDGTDFLCLNFEYPAHDLYEKMYACHFQRVIYKEGEEVVVIQTKFGSVVPKITVFIGLKESVPYLDKLLNILDNADSFSSKRISILTRLLAQKYDLGDDRAEQMENFIIYTCLDAANISASFGIFKSRKKSLSYDLINAAVDYICASCYPDWYRLAPGRRYARIGEVIEYIRRLKRYKKVEWTGPERAFCHTSRKLIDAYVFAEVYAVSLVLLKFLAENEIEDANSLRKAAFHKGLFSSTIMADTVDGFSANQLDGEAKKVFFSLIGKGNDSVKKRVEKALYRYHRESNFLFHYAHTIKSSSGFVDYAEKTGVSESLIEMLVICAAANAAVSVQKHPETYRKRIGKQEFKIIRQLFDNLCAGYNFSFSNSSEEAKDEVTKKLIKAARIYSEDEKRRMRLDINNSYELTHQLLPENMFLLVYLASFILLQSIKAALGNFDSLSRFSFSDEFEQTTLIESEELKLLIIEAKCRFAAMCTSDLLEIMAELDGKLR